jgi:hypothetical protein
MTGPTSDRIDRVRQRIGQRLCRLCLLTNLDTDPATRQFTDTGNQRSHMVSKKPDHDEHEGWPDDRLDVLEYEQRPTYVGTNNATRGGALR